MVDKNYKYTLLKKTSKTEIKNPQISICKVFGLFAMSVFTILYYTTKVTIDVDSTRLAVENSTEAIANSSKVTEKILNPTTEYESTTTMKTFITTSFVNQTVRDLDLTTPKKFLNTSRKPTPRSKLKKLLNSGKFYVNTEHCQMPWVDPFSSSAKKVFKAQKYEACSKDSDLISTFFNETQQRYILHINYSNMEDIKCCYQQIVRSGSGNKADKKYDLLPCTNFRQDFVVPQHIDAIIVICESKSKNQTLQKDAFSFIQTRNYSAEFKNSNDRLRKPNVLLFGIDSLSRFNFRRNMPKSAKFFEANNWIEMEGYNKVGDNTFPNLMPVLAGLNSSNAFSICMPTKVGGLDKCNFIWKNFKAHGYSTAYAEDATSMSTFNYIKKGFEKPPTDYYLRPLMMAVENKFPIKRKTSLIFCAGRRHSADYIYDFALEFANRHRKKPAFGLFWTNSFSHNRFSDSSSMDKKIHEYLEKMKNDGILETSIVVFFSDHGTRWGPLLNLAEGFLEERLPMFFMSFPKWFYETYPDYIKALKINANRLTTPYEAHQTLLHILNLNETSAKELEPAFSCEKSRSLFREIPANRTCDDACIPKHWCTCDPFEVFSPYNSDVKHVTDLVIVEMNNYLKANNFSTLCQKLSRDSIKSAELKLDSKEAYTQTETFRINFKVKPKSAKFQATVVFNLLGHDIQVDVEDISRLDSYEKHSYCVNHKIAKKFCICN